MRLDSIKERSVVQDPEYAIAGGVARSVRPWEIEPTPDGGLRAVRIPKNVEQRLQSLEGEVTALREFVERIVEVMRTEDLGAISTAGTEIHYDMDGETGDVNDSAPAPTSGVLGV